MQHVVLMALLLAAPKAQPKAEPTKENKVQQVGQNPEVIFKTNKGEFVIKLYADKAPLSTKNFLRYVDEGFYNGTIFHRVIKDFMIQGGGFSENLQQKNTHEPIKNEAGNGLKNKRGTVAMARTMVVDSATSQFFINVTDNAFLDHTSNDPQGYGYAVIGEVIKGMDIVDQIRATETDCPSNIPKPCDKPLPPGMRDVPHAPIVILSAKRQ